MAPGAVVNDDLENYGADDFGSDPFAESGDDNANKADSQSKKRKDASGLGIDEAVAVSKKVRVPRVKLDDKKLLSDKGIPKLRKKAGDLKFKGKGHEFSDTARLLSFYQLWLDDLYPKAKFLDALTMVEKAGHTRSMRLARMDWINEGKPRSATQIDENDDSDLRGLDHGREPAIFPARVAPIFEKSNRPAERPKTPSLDDLFGDDDLYDATPKASRTNNASAATNQGLGSNAPDEEDDLDALMAEEEAQRQAPTSIFGNGQLPSRRAPPPSAPDEDDLDALMAEAEAATNERPKPQLPARNDAEEDDDLDALMAEAEAQGSIPGSKSSKTPGTEKSSKDANADDEEAMAEMDGLW
ncbi:hypothetical protein PFICI_13428 [Pestalotiopsis fici W106-1]|uniref:Chromosome segregation in meiosis protein n=1 Tax=Pestalotiopsis fici (strain W106-1 / CGMCC3.15140) TaxID=1229662 RepID=W3WMF3_PESFW|nr:uncharacterized protein PFICI_13428 [Pestalotiopsis fici W106-1]ETS74944.1 hypothetical protein PFICI_13428 [Pestalotiopsis fici W106-1]